MYVKTRVQWVHTKMNKNNIYISTLGVAPEE